MVRHRPADDAPAEDVEDHRQVEKALPPRRDIGDVRDPALIRRAGSKRALDQVRRWRGRRITTRGVEGAPARAAGESGTAHEACDAVVPAPGPMRPKLRVDAWHARGATARLVTRADLLDELRIGLGPHRGGALPLAPGPGAAGGDTQHAAQPDDGVLAFARSTNA